MGLDSSQLHGGGGQGGGHVGGHGGELGGHHTFVPLTIADLQKMKRSDLQSLCKERKLKSNQRVFIFIYFCLFIYLFVLFLFKFLFSHFYLFIQSFLFIYS